MSGATPRTPPSASAEHRRTDAPSRIESRLANGKTRPRAPSGTGVEQVVAAETPARLPEPQRVESVDDRGRRRPRAGRQAFGQALQRLRPVHSNADPQAIGLERQGGRPPEAVELLHSSG